LLRELNFLKEESSLFALVILAPFFFAFFYSTVYLSNVETDIKIAVVDNDKSELSRTLTRYLDANQQLEIYTNSVDFNEAEELVKEDKIPAFLFIDKGFEKSIKQTKSFTLPLYVNNTRFLTSNDINKAVNHVAATFSAGIKLKYFESNKFSKEQSFAQIEPIRIDMHSLYNFTESYGAFVISGLLALILQQTLLIGISLTFAKEIEEKRTKELFDLGGKSFTKSILMKSLIYLVFFALIALFFYTITFNIFSVKLTGSIAALSLLTLVYLVSVIAFGFFLSTFIKKKTAVLQVFAFSSLPFFLASGYSWPKTAIPNFINWIMYAVPSTTYLESFTKITQKGQGFARNEITLIVLMGISLIYFTAGIYRFRKN